MNLTFIEHVHELRRRAMLAAGVAVIGGFCAYAWHNTLLALLEAPLHQTLYYSKVTGAFEFIVRFCFLAGILLAAPVILYQLLAFVRPALPRPIPRRHMFLITSLASALVFSGVLFGYFISLPAALRFLGSIDTAHLHTLLAADSYLTFVINYLAVFGLAFLLPLILSFIDRIRPLPPARLAKARKWVIGGAFGAALILPIAPDPVSQMLLAVPVIALYEVSIMCIWLHHRRLPRPVTINDPN